jgi:hypothetical protein
MVRYATALRLGTAEAEQVLRRLTRDTNKGANGGVPRTDPAVLVARAPAVPVSPRRRG